MVLNITKASKGLYTVDGLRFGALVEARNYATCMAKAKGCEYFMSPECREEWGKER